ncbi:MAG: hypothetical protein M0C28_03590 [Candidatus Moduliflexus flocculans]|nr:hypothetical protein [Candidatus Moduliflexus flocculans]
MPLTYRQLVQGLPAGPRRSSSTTSTTRSIRPDVEVATYEDPPSPEFIGPGREGREARRRGPGRTSPTPSSRRGRGRDEDDARRRCRPAGQRRSSRAAGPGGSSG